MVGMEGMPSVDMGSIYKDISDSKVIAKNIHKEELSIIDGTIKELALIKKSVVAGNDATINAKHIDREIATLSKLKKSYKNGIQSADQAHTRRLEISMRASSAFVVAGAESDTSKKLLFRADKLRVLEGNLNAKMKGIDKNLNASLGKCVKFMYDNQLLVGKPESRFTRIKSALLGLFSASKKPKDTLDGMAQSAKQVESTAKTMSSEAKKATIANEASVKKFVKKNEKMISWLTTTENAEKLIQKTGTEYKRLDTERKDTHEMVGALKNDKAHIEKDIESIKDLKKLISKGDTKGAKQAVNIMAGQFKGQVTKAETEIKSLKTQLEQLDKEEADRYKISKMLGKGDSQRNALRADIRLRMDAASNRAEFFREGLSGPGKLLDFLEKGDKKGATAMLDKSLKSMESNLRAVDGAIQTDVDRALAMDSIFTLESSAKRAIHLIKTRNEVSMANTQGIKDWIDDMQMHITNVERAFKSNPDFKE